MGGIIGSNVYLSSQAPRYPAGFGSGLGSSACAILAAFVLRIAYRGENQKRQARLNEMGDDELRSHYTEEQLLDLGDKSPFFIYTL